MINQITVFLENKGGRLASLCRSLADAGVNMEALTIADTADYGIARIVCDKPEEALKALDEAGYRAKITKVVGVELPNRPGSLAELLEFVDEKNLNVEYGYCFSNASDTATQVMKLRDIENAAVMLKAAGFDVI
ncbi:MAG: amino acid-binding protein [bacterium]|nr:amino acid-binding protein [bacterium]